jgi:hypothetical protein
LNLALEAEDVRGFLKIIIFDPAVEVGGFLEDDGPLIFLFKLQS